MNEDELGSLSRSLQKAFDTKDLETVLSFYHPDIVLISPSYSKPIIGLDALRKAISRQFDGPQRTNVTLNDLSSYQISESVFVVTCIVAGLQSIHLSRYDFKGLISRIFVGTEAGPRIICEHLSLINK